MSPDRTPRNKRLEEGDRSKEGILDAATRMMSARGYDGTSISALAKESGLSASSIYWHFSSKAGVLAAVMERAGARFRAARTLTEIPSDGTHLEKVVAIFERSVEAVQQNPEFIRLQTIFLLNSPAGEVNESVMRLRAQQREGLREALVYTFSDVGEALARNVVDDIIDYAVATFEGMLLGALAGSTATSTVLRQLSENLVAMADKAIDAEGAPA